MEEAEEIPLFFTLIPVLALLSNYDQENCLINVGTEGFAQVRGEVGRQVKPFDGGPDYTSDRDQALIAELVRRGLSEAQVIELLTDVQPTPDAYNLRLGAVIQGFRDAGTTSFVSRSFLPALREYERIGPVASKSVATL